MELGEGVEHVEPLHVYDRRVDAELGPENWEIVQSDLISQKKMTKHVLLYGTCAIIMWLMKSMDKTNRDWIEAFFEKFFLKFNENRIQVASLPHEI